MYSLSRPALLRIQDSFGFAHYRNAADGYVTRSAVDVVTYAKIWD